MVQVRRHVLKDVKTRLVVPILMVFGVDLQDHHRDQHKHVQIRLVRKEDVG